eukprot:SAG22_NODE_18770_length_281_cov_1.692308_1_plen_79_part_01
MALQAAALRSSSDPMAAQAGPPGAAAATAATTAAAAASVLRLRKEHMREKLALAQALAAVRTHASDLELQAADDHHRLA